MSDNSQCQCPPFPHFAPGSLASGSATETAAHRRWEAEHGSHPAAIFARLEPVRIDPMQLAVYRTELRRHLERHGERVLMSIAPHHLHALLEAAGRVDAVSSKTQAYMDKALSALRAVQVDGEAPGETGRAVMAARDYLREAGAKNT